MKVRAFLRGCALWVGTPAVLFVLAVIFWIRFSPPNNLEAIGDSWYLGTSSTNLIIEAGTRFRSLYRKTGRRYVQVDRMIDVARYYAPDCVVYSAVRDYRGPIFAVCGDRMPVRIMNSGIDWSFEEDGLVLPRGRTLAGSNIRVETTELKPIEAIVALALRSPPYATDWPKSDSPLPHDQVDTVKREP